jgi:predicted ester cyclase
MIADEDKVAVKWDLTGTHDGEFMGIKPTGNKISVCVMNFYYFNKAGKVTNDVAAEGMIGILRGIGAMA